MGRTQDRKQAREAAKIRKKAQKLEAQAGTTTFHRPQPIPIARAEPEIRRICVNCGRSDCNGVQEDLATGTDLGGNLGGAAGNTGLRLVPCRPRPQPRWWDKYVDGAGRVHGMSNGTRCLVRDLCFLGIMLVIVIDLGHQWYVELLELGLRCLDLVMRTQKLGGLARG